MSVTERSLMNIAMNIDPASEYKRAQILFTLILMGAGNFVGTLKWDAMGGAWEDSGKYLRETNLDVIAAEAIIWITFLMGQLWKNDQKKDREMFLRVGFVTVSTAGAMALQSIQSETGFDFETGATESRRLYLQAIKDGAGMIEPFASVVLRSIGKSSLASPPNMIGPLPPLEFTPITFVVSTFFSTIPSGLYDTFKNILREWPDKFPHDDDFTD